MPLWRRECGAIPVVQGGKRTDRAPGRGQSEPERTNDMKQYIEGTKYTLLSNRTDLDDMEVTKLFIRHMCVEPPGTVMYAWIGHGDIQVLSDSPTDDGYEEDEPDASIRVDTDDHEIQEIASTQGPKHKTSGLAEGNPRDTMLSEPNSLDSVGQAELGVALDGSGAVLPPQRQGQSTPNTVEAQGKSIEVGSRWRYLGNHAPDIVVEVNDCQIITESVSTLSEHCWLRDEFLRVHAPV